MNIGASITRQQGATLIPRVSHALSRFMTPLAKNVMEHKHESEQKEDPNPSNQGFTAFDHKGQGQKRNGPGEDAEKQKREPSGPFQLHTVGQSTAHIAENGDAANASKPQLHLVEGVGSGDSRAPPDEKLLPLTPSVAATVIQMRGLFVNTRDNLTKFFGGVVYSQAVRKQKKTFGIRKGAMLDNKVE